MKDMRLTKTFASSYGEISYDIQGNGPPLILVHGTPWSSFNWRHIIPALSHSFTVYYYDLLGYGQSEKKDGADVSLEVQNLILAELLDHWGLDAPKVVGHDFGGTTVLRTHLLGKRAFSKMILIDPVAVAPWGSPFFAHVNKYEAAFQGIPDHIHKAVVSEYVKGAKYKEMDGETLHGIVSPWLGEEGRKAFYRQIAQASQRYTDEVEPLYAEIAAPVLIIWGEKDEWIPIDKGLKLHSMIPESRFVSIPDAGHLVQEDDPSLLLYHMLVFLS